MKKINSIIMAACVAALGFFTSCSGPEENDPQVNLLNTNGVIDIKVGGTAAFGYTVKKGSSDIQLLTVVLAQKGVELTQELIKIDATTKDAPTLKDLNKAGGYTFAFDRPFATEGEFTVTITATDKDGFVGSKKATITVTAAGSDIVWVDQFEAKQGDVYAYKYDDVEKGTFTISSVLEEPVTSGSLAGQKSYKITFSGGIQATISYNGMSYVNVDGSTSNSTTTVGNNAVNLLLYVEKNTNIIKAGQKLTNSASLTWTNSAKDTFFAKQ